MISISSMSDSKFDLAVETPTLLSDCSLSSDHSWRILSHFYDWRGFRFALRPSFLLDELRYALLDGTHMRHEI